MKKGRSNCFVLFFVQPNVDIKNGIAAHGRRRSQKKPKKQENVYFFVNYTCFCIDKYKNNR